MAAKHIESYLKINQDTSSRQ